jgi:hypothetical protein
VRSSGSGQCNAEYDQVWCPHEYAAPQHAHKLVPAGAVPAGAHLHGSTASLFRLLYGVLSVDDSGTFLGTWQHAAHVHAQRIIATQYAPDSKHLTDEDALRTYITKAGITDLHERIRLAYVFLGSVYRVIAFLYPHTASPLDQAHFVESLCMVIGDEIEPQAFIDQLSHAEEMLNIHNLKLAYARHVLFT